MILKCNNFEKKCLPIALHVFFNFVNIYYVFIALLSVRRYLVRTDDGDKLGF